MHLLITFEPLFATQSFQISFQDKWYQKTESILLFEAMTTFFNTCWIKIAVYK